MWIPSITVMCPGWYYAQLLLLYIFSMVFKIFIHQTFKIGGLNCYLSQSPRANF